MKWKSVWAGRKLGPDQFISRQRTTKMVRRLIYQMDARLQIEKRRNGDRHDDHGEVEVTWRFPFQLFMGAIESWTAKINPALTLLPALPTDCLTNDCLRPISRSLHFSTKHHTTSNHSKCEFSFLVPFFFFCKEDIHGEDGLNIAVPHGGGVTDDCWPHPDSN